MVTKLKVGEIDIDVVRKDIKNVHLSVFPPMGKVRISAPERMDIDTIRVFAISKLSWIKQQQRKLQEQVRETTRQHINRESHYVWGKRYLIKVVEKDLKPSVELKHSHIRLQVRPGTDSEAKQEIMAQWYRDRLKIAAQDLIAKWEPLIGVKVDKLFVQHMKTKWGGCNPSNRSIRLNTELAKKPIECLEYIVVHEMAHLLEPTHNARFITLLDNYMPKWQFYRDMLNRLPVRQESWAY